MKDWDKGKYKLQIIHPDGYWEDVPVHEDKPEPNPKRNDDHSEDCEICHQAKPEKLELWEKMRDRLNKHYKQPQCVAYNIYKELAVIAEEHFKDSK